MKLELSATRCASRLCVRLLTGLLAALPGWMALGPTPAMAQSIAPDFDRFTIPASPGSGTPGSSGGTANPVSPGLYVQVLNGVINVGNPGGASQFHAGQFGFTPPSGVTLPPIVLPVSPGVTFTPPTFFLTPPSQTVPPFVMPIVSPVVTPLPPPAAVLSRLANGPGYYLLNWGSDGLGNLGAGTATFNVLNWLTNFSGSTFPFTVNSTLTAVDVGQLDDLGWGRWTSGSVSDHGTPFDLSTWKSGMPYVVGLPTTDAGLPVSGTMTYALAGATKAIDSVTGAIGTLSGSLSIDFHNAQYNVTPNLSVAMTAGQTYVTGSGTTTVGPNGARATFSTLTQNVTGGACTGGACTFLTQGVLTGAAANNAGIVYSLTGPDLRVTGAAGFKR